MHIRPFTPEDYPAAVAVGNAVEPDYPETEQEWRHYDANRDPRCRWERFLVEVDGAVVGVGGYSQDPHSYHPRNFDISVSIHPAHRERGLGSALYEHVREAVRPFDPLLLRTWVREDREPGMRFLRKRGFVERMREWESRLDIRAFDPSRWPGAVERVLAQGIQILTLAELAGDPDRDRKLHEMEQEIEKDIPTTLPVTPVEFESWRKRVLESPNLLPEAYFIAVHEGRYVGESVLWQTQSGDYLDTGLTGVIRDYRRKGIALALKLKAMEYARRSGRPEVRTWNATTNQGMLSINVDLGFQRQPAWVELGLPLGDAPESPLPADPAAEVEGSRGPADVDAG